MTGRIEYCFKGICQEFMNYGVLGQSGRSERFKVKGSEIQKWTFLCERPDGHFCQNLWTTDLDNLGKTLLNTFEASTFFNPDRPLRPMTA